MAYAMTRRGFLRPQFESSRLETWCFGIIYELHDLSRQNEDADSVNELTSDEKRTELEDNLDLPNLRMLKPELYEMLFSTVVRNVRKVCSVISNPSERLLFQSRFLENIFLNVLKENELLTEPTKYYYESVLDIFPMTTLGLAFFIDFISDQGWYKYGSKFLVHLSDPNQVEIILTKLNELSCDIHFTVLKVIWLLEISLERYDDNDDLMRFVTEANQLKEQSVAKAYDLKENLAIYLAILNVYLDAFLVNTAKRAARERGMDKPIGPNEYPHDKNESEIMISLEPVSSISNFICDLEKILFPSREYNNNELLHDCFENPKSAAILEMVAFISGIYEFLNVILTELKVLPQCQLKFEVFEAIKSGWHSWEHKSATVESSFWEILSLDRLFSPDCEESRFLTIAVINNGLPKYFDVLEEIPSETYLDPYVMHALGLAIGNAEQVRYMDNLILILKKILRSVRLRKRIAFLFKTRVDLFGLHNYGEPHKSKLNLFLNHQQSGSINYNQVRDDILLSAYLYPCEFIDRMLADALEHRHTMLPFLCNLLYTELSPVCSAVVDTRFDNTFFECLLNSRFTTPPSEASIQGLMSVIKDIHTYYCNANSPILPKILTLERLMLRLTWDGVCDPTGSINAKFSVFKLIQNLSDACDTPWDLVKKDPQYILYNLVQFIDHFFNQPSRKNEIINFIEFIMNNKVRRELTDDEYIWMHNTSEFHQEEISLLAYLAPYLESKLSKFYRDISVLKPWHVLMIAAFTRDNIWLRYAYRGPVKNDFYLKEQIAAVMKIFSREEYDNIFYFLCHFLRIDQTISALISAYQTQRDWVPIDVEYETNCLCDCIEFHCENYYKQPKLYDCKKGIYIYSRLTRDKLLPMAFDQVDRMWNFPLASKADEQRVERTLTKLAEEMKKLNVDAFEWFFKDNNPIDRRSKSILRQFYGPLQYIPKPIKEPTLIPAGYRY